MSVSVYGGTQSARHSDVSVSGRGERDFVANWEGRSLTMPPYYGVRGIYWLEGLGQPNIGLSLDFSHAKAYGDRKTLLQSGYSRLEFTDGLNLLTLNALYRMPITGTSLAPYVGTGVGINIPHVEVGRATGTTEKYAVGGPTVQVQVGLAYQLSDHWSAFTEYKGNYSWVDVDIDSGSTLNTNILTNALNIGLTFRWGGA